MSKFRVGDRVIARRNVGTKLLEVHGEIMSAADNGFGNWTYKVHNIHSFRGIFAREQELSHEEPLVALSRTQEPEDGK